jgi:hypothetical protein
LNKCLSNKELGSDTLHMLFDPSKTFLPGRHAGNAEFVYGRRDFVLRKARCGFAGISDKTTHLVGILAARRALDTTGHIDSIGPN